VLDEDGWFHTGDLCAIDAEGQVTLKGRTKSVINVAGIKVFAERVKPSSTLARGARVTRHSLSLSAAVGEIPVAELVACNQDQPPPSPNCSPFAGTTCPLTTCR